MLAAEFSTFKPVCSLIDSKGLLRLVGREKISKLSVTNLSYNMATTINDVQIVEYNKLFSEEPKPLNAYLDGISRRTLLTIGTHFLGFKDFQRHLNYEDFINRFFHPENDRFKKKMLDKMRALQNVAGRRLLIVNTVSSLEFFQYVFENSKEEETQSELEIEQNVFLAYLVINQNTRKDENTIIPSVGDLPIEKKIWAIYFTQSYAYSNLVNYNESELIAAELIKAILLFEFLSSNSKTLSLTESFLKHYNFNHGRNTYSNCFHL
jgi:hypothetical protein